MLFRSQYGLITRILASDPGDGAWATNSQLWVCIGEASIALVRCTVLGHTAKAVTLSIASVALLSVVSVGGEIRSVDGSSVEWAEDGDADAHQSDGHFGGRPDDQRDSVHYFCVSHEFFNRDRAFVHV